MHKAFLLFFLVSCFGTHLLKAQSAPMMFGDTTGTGIPYSKDPVVVNFKGRYLMYFSIRKFPERSKPMSGWAIGIAESQNLKDWRKIGEILPDAEYERKGLCAPGAVLRDGKIHLFYQTYGNGPKDAICHAMSEDGIRFTRNPTNPVFRPTGDWNNGRAIDAEVYFYKDRYFLYYATRDPDGKVQMQGVATASANTNFNREEWTQAADYSILRPELSWEGECVEGASIIKRNGKLYMFYAGAYNNWPQQIGLATSKDGILWKRVSDLPFLPNGKPGEWNSSESGHPCIFEDTNGRTYLFYQGNSDQGRSWLLSHVEIGWTRKGPYIKKDLVGK